jgi:hypothetical protein
MPSSYANALAAITAARWGVLTCPELVLGQSAPTVRSDCPVYSAGSCATTPHLHVVQLFYIVYIVYSDSIEVIQKV